MILDDVLTLIIICINYVCRDRVRKYNLLLYARTKGKYYTNLTFKMLFYLIKKGKNMKKTTQLLTITTTALLFLGCSNQEMQVAQTLANSAASASGVTPSSPMKSSDVLSSAESRAGFVQGQAIGASTLANPAVLGMGAYAAAQNAKRMEENKKSYNQLSNMMENSDQANDQVANVWVRAYNKKYGTNYRTMEELQDSAKVSGYNEQYGTQFKTLTEVREHYNKEKGTNFKTDQELRDYIAANR